MDPHHKELLAEIGLSDGEVKVYNTLLKLHESHVGPIVSKSGVHTSKVYPILDRLVQKGLVSQLLKNNKKHYVANNPQSILAIIREKQNRLQRLEVEGEKFVSILESSYSQNPSDVSLYLGFEGMKHASEKIYSGRKPGETLYYLGIPAKQPKLHHIYWQKEHVRRSEHGIKVKLLFNQGTAKSILANRNSYKLSEARMMPTKIKTPALFAMYGEVVLIILQEPDVVTIEIQNEHIARSFKSYFDQFWRQSAKI